MTSRRSVGLAAQALACAILWGGTAAWAQLAPPSPAEAAAPAADDAPSFDIRMDAPEDVRELLERHLLLQRYRAVTDLDANELERVLVLARRDALELLGTLGYFSPDIDIRQQPAAPEQRPTIVVTVNPGPATQVSGVQVEYEGDLATSPDEDAVGLRAAIERDWRLRPGRRFTQEAWDEAKTQALRQLVARRYPAGRISYSLADVDAPANRVALAVRLDSGPLYRLGPLRVTGLQRYDPVLVPRLARLAPGEVYDQRKLVEAQQRLAGSGYFDAAYLTIDPNDNPAAVPVSVQLREAQLQKVVLGLGFATDTGPRLSLEHVHNRVPMLGWRADTKLQLDSKSPFAQTEWTSLPDESLWRWVTSLRLERVDDDALLTRTQRWRVGRLQTGERIDRNIYLQYDSSRVSGQGESGATDASTGEGSSLSANYAWTGRYFDSLPFPNRGYAIAAELGAGSTLGDDKQPYTRAVVRWTGIVPLGSDEQISQARRGRLALRLEAGVVSAARDAQIPAAQLFRVGGDTSVRGYGLREIGIPLPSGATGPGRYMSTGSIEWQQPIRRGGQLSDWEATFFVDGGNVADRASDLGKDVAFGVGTGARWKSPIGPLQIDLAYGLQVEKLRLHLTVGWVF